MSHPQSQTELSLPGRLCVWALSGIRWLQFILLGCLVFGGLATLLDPLRIGGRERMIAFVLFLVVVAATAIEWMLKYALRSLFPVEAVHRFMFGPAHAGTASKPTALPWGVYLTVTTYRLLRSLRFAVALVFAGALVSAVDGSGQAGIDLLLLGCAVVGFYFVEWLMQWQINRVVSAALSAADAGGRDQKIVLFLRSFDRSFLNLTLRRVMATVLAVINIVVGNLETMRPLVSDIERDVGDVASASGAALLAIGDKYFTIGATKIRSHDNRWKELFDSLAARAAVIVCEIHSTPSCLWEIGRIGASPALVGKTIFVLPPTNLLLDYTLVLATADQVCLRLPEYRPGGWLYVTSPQPMQHNIEQLDELVQQRLI